MLIENQISVQISAVAGFHQNTNVCVNARGRAPFHMAPISLLRERHALIVEHRLHPALSHVSNFNFCHSRMLHKASVMPSVSHSALSVTISVTVVFSSDRYLLDISVLRKPQDVYP